MKVILIKDFGIHPAGTELEANEILYNHLLKGGFIADEPKVVKPKVKGK